MAVNLGGMLLAQAAGRQREFATRLALGARAGQVVGMVLREALVLLGLGIALGAAASLVAGRGLASLLYQLRPSDPVSLAAAALLPLGVGLASALIPARRASRTDPARTRRSA